jgi:hypothetical protein
LAKTVLILAGLWCVAVSLYDVLIYWTSPAVVFEWTPWYHAPGNYPSAKLGVILNVAARPMPLLCFFLCIATILPSTVDVVSERLKRRVGGRQWPSFLCAVVAFLAWAALLMAVFSPWPFGIFFGG